MIKTGFQNDIAIVLKSIRYTKVYFWLQFHYKCIQSSNVVVVSDSSRWIVKKQSTIHVHLLPHTTETSYTHTARDCERLPSEPIWFKSSLWIRTIASHTEMLFVNIFRLTVFHLQNKTNVEKINFINFFY